MPPNAVLAGLAHAEAEAHPPRTPERRAAAALWTVLIGTRTIRGTRLALAAIPIRLPAGVPRACSLNSASPTPPLPRRHFHERERRARREDP